MRGARGACVHSCACGGQRGGKGVKGGSSLAAYRARVHTCDSSLSSRLTGPIAKWVCDICAQVTQCIARLLTADCGLLRLLTAGYSPLTTYHVLPAAGVRCAARHARVSGHRPRRAAHQTAAAAPSRRRLRLRLLLLRLRLLLLRRRLLLLPRLLLLHRRRLRRLRHHLRLRSSVAQSPRSAPWQQA